MPALPVRFHAPALRSSTTFPRRATRIVALLSLTMAGCGGSTAPNQDPDDPDPPALPASIVIQSGNGQTAPPSSAVAQAISVVVRDARGQPFKGATVNFTVTVGGGTLERSTAISGDDGSASPGVWTLGQDEAENRVRATSGSLSPVEITAQARHPRTTLLNAEVPTSGGTFTYSSPGAPNNGFSVTVPSGAFQQPINLNIRSAPAALVGALPNGLVARGAFEVVGDIGYTAGTPITVRIPLRVGPDSAGMALLYDRASGAIEMLPLAAANSNIVTVVTRHLSRSALAVPQSAPFLHGAQGLGEPDLLIVPTAVSFDMLSRGPIETEFSPGDDDWEFPNFGSYATPFGHATGQSASALYYFIARGRREVGLGLTGKYVQHAFWAGNRLGYRVAALTEKAINLAAVQSFTTRMDQLATNQGFSQAGFAHADGAYHLAAAHGMLASGHPQLVIASAPGQPAIGLLAYRATASGLWVIDPAVPGVGRELKISGGQFQPLLLSPTAAQSAVPYTTFKVVGISTAFDINRIQDLFAQLDAGSVNTPDFPPYVLEYLDDHTGVWTPLQNDVLNISWPELDLRARCTTCDRALSGNGVVVLDVYDGLGNQLVSDRTTGIASFTVPSANNRIGVHIHGGTGQGPIMWRHLDFRPVTVNASAFSIIPNPGTPDVNVPLQLTAKNTAPNTPMPIRYNWSFGDNTTQQRNNDSTVTHTWTSPGTFDVNLVVTHGSSGEILGKASATMHVGTRVPVWRLNTFQNTLAIFGHLPIFFPDGNWAMDDGLFRTLQSQPRFGLIAYQPTATVVGAQTFPPGIYLQQDNGQLTGIDFARAAIGQLIIVGRPPRVPPVGQELEQLTFNLNGIFDAGSLSGTSVTVPWTHFGQPFAITTWRITATASGSTLSGEIRRFQRVIEFKFNDPAWDLRGIIEHRWNFTATRVR